MIEQLIQDFVEKAEIHSVDDRGYFIINDSYKGLLPEDSIGFLYLFNDGIVRGNTRKAEENIAFWTTQSEAETFFKEWKEKWKNQSI